MDSITVPSSVFVNGQWATAHWAVEMVDGESGELVITATVVNGQAVPVVTALRMNMELARELRAMALSGAEQPCYDCRTTGERLASLEKMITSLHEHQVLDARRVDALEDRPAFSLHEQQRMDDITGKLRDTAHRLEQVYVDHAETRSRVNRLEDNLRHTRFVAMAEQGQVGHSHDCGFWIPCPFCKDDEKGMCSACNGTRQIWEMPPEDEA